MKTQLNKYTCLLIEVQDKRERVYYGFLLTNDK